MSFWTDVNGIKVKVRIRQRSWCDFNDSIWCLLVGCHSWSRFRNWPKNLFYCSKAFVQIALQQQYRLCVITRVRKRNFRKSPGIVRVDLSYFFSGPSLYFCKKSLRSSSVSCFKSVIWFAVTCSPRTIWYLNGRLQKLHLRFLVRVRRTNDSSILNEYSIASCSTLSANVIGDLFHSRL